MNAYLLQHWDTVLYAAILGGGGLWFAIENRAKLAGWLPSRGKTTVPANIDVSDLLALQQLQARAVRNNCAAGKKAVQDMFACFFHKEPHS